MSERVSVFEGKTPVIIIAPHCPESTNTNFIAEQMISSLGCYGVINRGWRKSDTFNYDEEEADCNNIDHIHNDVIKNEFLIPILRFHQRIRKSHSEAHIFIIRGVKSEAKHESGDPFLDIILGYGAGKPPAYSFGLLKKDFYVDYIEKGGLIVYEGKPRSNHSARSKLSLNQLFNISFWYQDKITNSMQIEVINDLREDEEISRITGEFLADGVKSLLNMKNWNRPINKKQKLI